jgi:glycosyltransferase involved in cell wall biosynthesis
VTERKILLVTPYFAPQTHAAVFRVHKLAKYLPRFGWKPYVLTVDTNYLYNEDPQLLCDLPEEVEVVRSRYIEPTVRGVRMALGGRNRSFAAVRAAGELDPYAQGRPVTTPRRRPRRIYDVLLKRWIQVPDPYWTWYRPALAAGLRLVREHGITLAYTTFLPYTCNRIGMALQRHGCRWIADFRDPGTYSERMRSPFTRVVVRQRRIERETLLRADRVTCLSSCYPSIFHDMYGPLRSDPIRFIPTGADTEFFPTTADPAPFPFRYLLYSGEFLPEYGDEFLQIFSVACKTSTALPSDFRILVVGHEILNRQRLSPRLQRLQIEDYFEFVDHVPQRDLYRWIHHADACLLIPGGTRLWWANFAKMVDYIALKRPVLAVVPNPSEARRELDRTGLGMFLDVETNESCRILTEFMSGGSFQCRPDHDACSDYTVKRSVERFVDLFEEL